MRIPIAFRMKAEVFGSYGADLRKNDFRQFGTAPGRSYTGDTSSTLGLTYLFSLFNHEFINLFKTKL